MKLFKSKNEQNDTSVVSEAKEMGSATKNQSKGNIAKNVILGILIAAVIVVMFFVSDFFVGAIKGMLNEQEKIRNGITQVQQSGNVSPTPATTVTENSGDTAESTVTPQPTPEGPRTILEKYAKDAEKNPDMYGWIKIEGTRVDYPVMYTPDDPEKYIYKNFNGIPSANGTPFMEAKCSPNSDNIIIYGHNMKTGAMFNNIIKYENIHYLQKHPTVQFDTLYEEQEYEVMAMFYDRVYYATEDVFKFYQFIDAENEEDFNNAVEILKKKSMHETNVTAEYGDQLLMLVTCAYHTDNGRFVLVARKAQ